MSRGSVVARQITVGYPLWVGGGNFLHSGRTADCELCIISLPIWDMGGIFILCGGWRGLFLDHLDWGNSVQVVLEGFSSSFMSRVGVLFSPATINNRLRTGADKGNPTV